MKERPILYAGAMVRALRADLKTMTRRLVNGAALDWLDREGFTPEFVALPENGMCPYGQPGDRLWVRERGWERPPRTRKMMCDGADTWERFYYDADGLSPTETEDLKTWGFKRRPSIHMPRWASRISLEITSVRIQRLQSISEEDALAEGTPGGHGSIPGYGYNAMPGEHFMWLWQQLYGSGSWAANPWVWVLEFRRLQEGGAA